MNRSGNAPSLAAQGEQEAMVSGAAGAAVYGLPGGAGKREAYMAVRAAVGEVWDRVTPEAARDLLAGAANFAREHGVRAVPSEFAEDDLSAARALLALGDGMPVRRGRVPTAADLFASSVAFDREEDDETLSSLAVLLALGLVAAAG